MHIYVELSGGASGTSFGPSGSNVVVSIYPKQRSRNRTNQAQGHPHDPLAYTLQQMSALSPNPSSLRS